MQYFPGLDQRQKWFKDALEGDVPLFIVFFGLQRNLSDNIGFEKKIINRRNSMGHLYFRKEDAISLKNDLAGLQNPKGEFLSKSMIIFYFLTRHITGKSLNLL